MEYILGVIVSALVQFSKIKWGLTSTKTLFAVAGISLVAAGLYTRFVDTEFWPLIVAVLTTAGSFYTFIIRRFETA